MNVVDGPEGFLCPNCAGLGYVSDEDREDADVCSDCQGSGLPIEPYLATLDIEPRFKRRIRLFLDQLKSTEDGNRIHISANALGLIRQEGGAGIGSVIGFQWNGETERYEACEALDSLSGGRQEIIHVPACPRCQDSGFFTKDGEVFACVCEFNPHDVTLGSGDCLVSAAAFPNERVVSVGFAPGKGSGEIGTSPHNPQDFPQPDEKLGVTTRLIFTNAASIDVVIKELEKAKELLQSREWPPMECRS